MASASPVCWGEGGGGGGKRIKLFGKWVLGPAVRDASGHEENGSHGDGGPQLQGGEQKLLELREPEVLRGEDRPRPLQQDRKQGDCMEGEEGGHHGEGDDPQGRAPQPHGADNSVVTYSFLHSQRTPDRNRGNPWTVEEHRRFLKGLAEKGKGNWRAIAREFVKTRTPTQVATHAQKYFLRQGTLPRRRCSSIFDVALDAGDAGRGVPHERRAAQGGGEGGFRSQSPSPLPELALSLAPPSPAATSQPRRPSQPPSQPTPSATKVAPLRSEASAGAPMAAPVLHLARYSAASAAPFFPWNGVFARPAVERASPWPALWLTHHSFATSAQELQRLFSVATSSLGKGGEKDGADLATVA